MPRNRAKVCTGPRVLVADWILGKSQRKNGFVLFSRPIDDGIVGCDRLRASLTSAKRCCKSGLSPSTLKANCRLFSVYSWAHQTLVLSGKFRSCPKEANIWAGVPSLSLPQPPANKVSPQNNSPVSLGLLGGK